MRVNSKWLIVLLLLGVISLSGCSLPIVKKLQARDYLNKGVKQFTEQNYEAAAQLFQKSVDLDPDFIIARVYLATAYMNQFVPGSSDPRYKQMADKAIEIFTQVVDMSPDKASTTVKNAMLSIVGLYFQMDDFNKTKEWTDKVLAIDPNNAEAYYRIAVMEYKQVEDKTGLQGEKVKDLDDAQKTELKNKIENGLANIAKALTARADYYDAMEYQNLLWREKAKLETDEKAKAELIRQADMVNLQSMQLRRKAQEEAAKRPKTMGKAAE